MAARFLFNRCLSCNQINTVTFDLCLTNLRFWSYVMLRWVPVVVKATDSHPANVSLIHAVTHPFTGGVRKGIQPKLTLRA